MRTVYAPTATTSRLLMYGFLLWGLAACAPSPRVLTEQAVSLGTACEQAVARFAAAPSRERRQNVLGQLRELNAVLIEAAEYEQQARRSNSIDLPDANRAFLETGRAWGACSLRYNKVLVAIGERGTARHNYQGLLARLTGPQFIAERHQIQAALDALERAERH